MPEPRCLTSQQIVQLVSAAEARKIREAEAARRAIPSVRTTPEATVPEWRLILAMGVASAVGLVLWAMFTGG